MADVRLCNDDYREGYEAGIAAACDTAFFEGIEAGAAVAFGLMGMAEAIRARQHVCSRWCAHDGCPVAIAKNAIDEALEDLETYRPLGCPCPYLPAIDVEGHRYLRAVRLRECPIHGGKR